MANLCSISRQLTVLADAYGDGFSNVFYATNPVLLISLGLAGVSDGRWARWSGKFQQVVLEFTGGLVVCCYGGRQWGMRKKSKGALPTGAERLLPCFERC